MGHWLSMDDQSFLQQFESCALPLEKWHHREHVKVAYLYLLKYPLEDAAERMGRGIRAFNKRHNVPEGATSGYHETMTQAWLRLVACTLAVYGPKESADAFFDFHPQLSQKKALRFFYSPQRFLSPEAKTHFVEPDLTALPRAGR